MTAIGMITWITVGSLTAIFYLLTQQWSVRLINPQKARRSISLIVGGTFLRWVFIFTVLYVSLSYSLSAMLTVFLTHSLFRLLFLLKWQGWLKFRQSIINHSKG
jgi:hypothetical protein